MAEVTAFRRKRIRRAGAEDIQRIASQENYWSSDALRELLRRIETLNNEDPQQALEACKAVLNLAGRVREISPNLKALTLAVHGSVLRRTRQLDSALETYEKALAIDGLGKSGRGDVLARMAVTLVNTGRLQQGLNAVEEALALVADPVPVLVVRGWIKMFTHPLDEALEDFLRVLETAQKGPQLNYSVFWAIINSCSVLSYETLDAAPGIFERLQQEIDACRKTLPDGGSNYKKVRRPRLMLSRAEALIMMRTGREQKALYPLQRAAEGLKDHHPDDAIDAHTDLICLLARLEMGGEAVSVARSALELLDHVTYRVPPMGRNALLTVSRKAEISSGEAIEIRMMLRPQERYASR